MNAEAKRVASRVDAVLKGIRNGLHVLAEVADDLGETHQADRLHTAARMLDGIDREREVEEFLQAAEWTLEQIEIELDDLIYGEETDYGDTG